MRSGRNSGTSLEIKIENEIGTRNDISMNALEKDTQEEKHKTLKHRHELRMEASLQKNDQKANENGSLEVDGRWKELTEDRRWEE